MKRSPFKHATAALCLAAAGGAALSAPALAHPTPAHCPAPSDAAEPVIRIALCLDTSGSMEGLLNQARTRLWDVVNFLSTAKHSGKTPRLEVALFQYGSSRLPASEGYMRCVQPFTSDLDLLSERLFSLTINGSSEYCGQVLDSALKELDWGDPTHVTCRCGKHAHTRPHSSRSAQYSTIVIAGNEEFTQGRIDYVPVVTGALKRSIFVNTVYCGDASEGMRTGWADAANRAASAYTSIDHNRQYEYIRCPQDDRLTQLNTELNGTYIAYTVAGRENRARQEMQDSANAAASPEAAMQRTISKSSKMYSNSSWDIVDAVDAGKDIESIPSDSLPDNMRRMTLAERRAYVAELKAKRERIRAEIQALSAEREKWLADHRAAHHGGGGATTLDSALVQAIRTQAQRSGFTFSVD